MAETPWSEAFGGVFHGMTPFKSGVMSAAIAAVLIFLFRVARILMQRFRRRALAAAAASRQRPAARAETSSRRTGKRSTKKS